MGPAHIVNGGTLLHHCSNQKERLLPQNFRAWEIPVILINMTLSYLKMLFLALLISEGMLKRKIFLVGHSLGGHLAAYIASEMPELVSGLIIIDSPIRPPDYDYDKHISSGPLRPIKYLLIKKRDSFSF